MTNATKKSPFPIIPFVYTGLIIFEGSDCNPNGDPDNEGAPRVDVHTGLGIKSQQSTSRRVYERVQLVMAGVPGYDLQIQRGVTIENSILQAAADAGVKPSKKLGAEERRAVSRAACDRYFDTRMGGGVLGVGSCPANGVNGVVTFAWGKSIHPVNVRRDTLTRCSATNSEQEKEQEMGRRYVVSHGVWRQTFFVNPQNAEANGATLRDLAIYLDSLVNMFEHKRSVMSGMISMRGLYLFRHASKLGNAPAHKLLDRVKVSSPKGETAVDWNDYNLEFDAADLPKGIRVFTLEDMLGGVDSIQEKLLADHASVGLL